MKIKLAAVIFSLIIISTFFLTACHTVKGFGRDVEQGGKALQKAASQETDSTKA